MLSSHGHSLTLQIQWDPCDNSSNLWHFPVYAFFIPRIVMTTELHKMQAQDKTSSGSYSFGSTINSAVQTLLGWLDAFSLQCTDMFAACLR